MIFTRGQESCRFLFPVLGSLGASLLAQGSKKGGGDRQWWFMRSGDCMLAAGCRQKLARAAGRPEAHAEVSGSAAEMVASPLPRPHLPGRWWAASMVGSSRGFSALGCRRQGSDFNAASLVVKSRRESTLSSSLSWCFCLALPALGACGCLWDPGGPRTPEASVGQDLFCLVFLPPGSELLSWRPGPKAISSWAHSAPSSPCAL
jgi:hypothetical protein